MIGRAAGDAVQALLVDLKGNFSLLWSTAHALQLEMCVVPARNLEAEASIFKAIAEYVPLGRELLAGISTSLDRVTLLDDAVGVCSLHWLVEVHLCAIALEQVPAVGRAADITVLVSRDHLLVFLLSSEADLKVASDFEVILQGDCTDEVNELVAVFHFK